MGKYLCLVCGNRASDSWKNEKIPTKKCRQLRRGRSGHDCIFRSRIILYTVQYTIDVWHLLIFFFNSYNFVAFHEFKKVPVCAYPELSFPEEEVTLSVGTDRNDHCRASAAIARSTSNHPDP